MSLYENDSVEVSSVKKLEFICAQLIAHSTSGEHQGKKYDVYFCGSEPVLEKPKCLPSIKVNSHSSLGKNSALIS